MSIRKDYVDYKIKNILIIIKKQQFGIAFYIYYRLKNNALDNKLIVDFK